MNQTIAKLDVAPSRQQERGISGHGVFPCPGMGKDRNEPNMNLFLCELLTDIATTKD